MVNATAENTFTHYNALHWLAPGWGYPSPAPCESPPRQPRSRPPLPAPATPSDGGPRHRLQCCTRPRDPSSAKARRQSTAKPETGFVRIEKVGFAMDSPLEGCGFELSVPLPSQLLRRAVQGRYYSARRQLIKPLPVSSDPPSGASIATGRFRQGDFRHPDRGAGGALCSLAARHRRLLGGGRVIPSREGGDQLCYSTILTFAQLPERNREFGRFDMGKFRLPQALQRPRPPHIARAARRHKAFAGIAVPPRARHRCSRRFVAENWQQFARRRQEAADQGSSFGWTR